MSDEILAASPAWKLLGLRVVEAGEGRALVAMTAGPELVNFVGVIHGGYLATLADSAMGRALRSALPEGERHYTFDLKLNFINAAREGEELLAEGRVIHSGRRTALCECRITGPAGMLVATATATFSVYLPASKA